MRPARSPAGTTPAARVIVYGRNPVREAVRGRREVQRVWATAGAAKEEWPRLERADADAIERLCGSPEHQGVCAEVGPYPYADGRSLLESDDALVLALDEIQDPHNLGAVCRVAKSAGAAGVVIPERRSAEVTPATCKASAGAVEHLSIARVPNLADWLAWAKEAGAWVYGAAAPAGEPESSDGAPGRGGAAGRGPSEPAAAVVPYDQPDYRGRAVLVLGSEGRGLRPRVVSACDALVALPQHGRIGSLNVSTAAAALVYGILHLRVRGVDGSV